MKKIKYRRRKSIYRYLSYTVMIKYHWKQKTKILVFSKLTEIKECRQFLEIVNLFVHLLKIRL